MAGNKKRQIADKYDSSRSLVAVILTEEEATAPRPARKGKGKGKKHKRRGGQAGPPRRKVARPEGYGNNPSVIVEPWVPVRVKSVATALNYVRDTLGVHVPDNQVHLKGENPYFMAFYDKSWRKFIALDGKVYSRVQKGAMGERRAYPGLREVPCDACSWWTETNDLHPILVGVSNSLVHEFRICSGCRTERVPTNTKEAGYVVRYPKK